MEFDDGVNNLPILEDGYIELTPAPVESQSITEPVPLTGEMPNAEKDNEIQPLSNGQEADQEADQVAETYNSTEIIDAVNSLQASVETIGVQLETAYAMQDAFFQSSLLVLAVILGFMAINTLFSRINL